jgi:hypothetical protein
MHVYLIQVLLLQIVRLRRRPHIALPEKPHSLVPAQQNPHPHIKLALTEEQRPLNILLHDKRFGLHAVILLLPSLRDVGIQAIYVDAIVIPQDLLQVLYRIEYVDADAPVKSGRF